MESMDLSVQHYFTHDESSSSMGSISGRSGKNSNNEQDDDNFDNGNVQYRKEYDILVSDVDAA